MFYWTFSPVVGNFKQMFHYTLICLPQATGIFIIEWFNTFKHLKCLLNFSGTLLQVIIDKPKGGRGRLGSFSSSFKESKKEIVRQCFLFTNHLLLTTRASNGRLHLAKVSVRTSMDCNVSKWSGLCRYGQIGENVPDAEDSFLTVKCNTPEAVCAKLWSATVHLHANVVDLAKTIYSKANVFHRLTEQKNDRFG